MATLPRLQPRTFYDLVVEVALIRPGPDPGRVGAPLHPPPQRPGAGHLPAPAARDQPGQDARRAAVPGAADADGHRRRRVHPGRGRPAAPGHGLEAQPRSGWSGCASGSTTAWPSGASPARSPTRSSTSWPPSPTSASPSATRCPSPTSSTRRPGSSSTTRRRSARRCSTPSRWASARPHTLVQDARRHGVVVRTPDLNASLALATLEPCPSSHRRRRRAARARLGARRRRRPGRGDRGRASAVRRRWRTWCGAVPALTLPQLEALATAGAFGECFGLDRREALWAAGAVGPVAARAAWPASSPAPRAPTLPGMAPVEAAVADLWATGVAPDGHPTRFLRAAARRARRRHRGRAVATSSRRAGCWSAAWSPTASGRRPPRARRSSTSRTRPA